MPDEEIVLYRVELIGGPWDGAPGLYWADDGDHPCPDEIFVGRCPGRGECGATRCSPRRTHVCFWTSVEDVPTRTVQYEKEIDFVERHELSNETRFDGRARYVMGGVGMLPAARAEELVPAGAA